MTPSKSDRIAICGERFPTSLKRSILFFDRIGVFAYTLATLRTKALVRALSPHVGRTSDLSSDALGAVANDIEFLQSKNIAFDPRSIYESYPRPATKSTEAIEELSAFFSEVKRRIEQLRKEGPYFEFDTPTEEFVHQSMARSFAHSARHGWGLDVSVVMSKPLNIAGLHAGLKQPATSVVEVVLDKLPMPSEATPWEGILDFKADEEAQGYLQGLKVWMSDMARQKLTANEASEKLDWLLFQHKKHLKLHKLKFGEGTLGGTFVAGPEVLEGILSGKWLTVVGKVLGAAVSITDKKLELMKAELDNPFKEVAYIVKAQEQFGE
jgi:hypothetical protein